MFDTRTNTIDEALWGESVVIHSCGSCRLKVLWGPAFRSVNALGMMRRMCDECYGAFFLSGHQQDCGNGSLDDMIVAHVDSRSRMGLLG